MKAKPHGINFTDADWDKLERLASEMGVSTSAVVNQICGAYFFDYGDFEWQGLKPRGWNQHSEKDVNSDTPTD